MKLCHSLSALGREKKGIRLAAGFFDGVHRGHQAVIRRVIQEARGHGEKAWIMTFDTHPLKLLQPLAAPPLLTSTEHRIRLLESYGVQNYVILRFTRTMAELGPETFILRLVRAVRNLRGMVVGRNWTFGKNGTGTPELLKKLGAFHGFDVDIVRPARRRGDIISSTRIRRAVADGKITEAAAMLGRTFSIAGTVGSGRRIGRRLGTPTANVTLHNEVIPANGVYAVRAALGRRIYDGVANIGLRPTFFRSSNGKNSKRHKVLEVHLFDMHSDIRGRELEVFFVRKLREERRFATPEALKRQITRDIMATKNIL
ncbi:MAG: bifunctional riboflavin kinase/FAD synthetase [Kiritimatiellia bacterium]|nr:bifunctional riboflavin kinase/FAD synthetase [Kiritimatiellia bacterium]